MARNYMQDITPRPDEPEENPIPIHTPPEPAARSIRNIAPTSRPRPSSVPPPHPRRLSEVREGTKGRRASRIGMWIAIIIGLVLLAGLGALVLFPSTTVTATARTHTVQFDSTTQFSATPAGAATSSSITYTVVSEVFEDSTVVAASGIQRAEEKAMGTVTVYNSYSDAPVKLIKNTRFQSPDGLIFRIPQSIEVPGRRGTTPGSIEVTLFADQSGEQYNIGPVDKLTIPGLKSTPDMFAGVYAKAPTAFTGGFVGDRPAVAPSTLDAARAEMRGRLTERAQGLSQTVPAESIAFSGLMHVVFETLPPATEGGGGVRIKEKATVYMPVFSREQLAQTIGQSISASAEGQKLAIRFSPDTTGQSSEPINQADLGTLPLNFTLTGRGQLQWVIDSAELQNTLAGRDQGAFTTIIEGYPAIDTAEARLTPFWRTTFPADPSKITVTIQEQNAPL